MVCNDHGLNEDQINDFKSVFSMFDKDGDGRITVSELGDVMRSLGYQPKDKELKEMINEVDTDNNGTIELKEFIVMMSKRVTSLENEEENMRAAFRVFDRNKDGYISTSELAYIMNDLGEKLSEEELQEMITEADLDGDGLVNFKEFSTMLMSDKYQS